MEEASTSLYRSIVLDLESAGKESPYKADANELDPRYKSYGVRATEKSLLFKKYKKNIRHLPQLQQIALAKKLIVSGYGEQQSIALFILEQHPKYFAPNKLKELDQLMRHLHGWSKVDAYTGSLLREVLLQNPTEMTALIKQWNTDPDQWLRRMSVVLFTRKLAKNKQYTSFALDLCENLIHDQEPLVLKGVGWALKDLMKTNKKLIVDYVIKLRTMGVSSLITLYAIRDIKGEERNHILSIKAQN